MMLSILVIVISKLVIVLLYYFLSLIIPVEHLQQATISCLYRPAERPEGLSDCSVVNSTSQSLRVHCAPGHDGGLRQTFSLEVQDATTEELVADRSGIDEPR